MTNRYTLRRGLGLLMTVVCLIGMSRKASAIERKGLVVGIGVGTGKVNCDGCIAGLDLAAEGHIGLMVKNRLAIVLEVSEVEANNDSTDLFGVAVQYWASPRVWVKGGVGGGTTHTYFGESDPGLGFLGAVGVDILQKQWSAIDVQARFTTAKIEGFRYNNVSALVGFSFYWGSR